MFWQRRKNWPSIPVDEIRKRARLLVIDDQEFPYQTLFVRDGYHVDKWNDVERLTDVENGSYDVLLLDLQGVGRQESAEQGFGLLKHLRAAAPALVIVAYSNSDWGLQYQEFFRLADAVLPKSADYVEFKKQVDELLKTRFSLGFYVSKIVQEAGSYDGDRQRLDRIARDAILGQDVSKLRTHLASVIPDAKNVDRIISIANTAINIMRLWTS